MQVHWRSPELSSLKPPAVVITEGIPPIPVCVLEKIRKWEYIDLGSLLEQQDGPAQNITVSQSGQLVVTEGAQASRQAKPINDILTWLHAFSIYMAALVSADSYHLQGRGCQTAQQNSCTDTERY